MLAWASISRKFYYGQNLQQAPQSEPCKAPGEILTLLLQAGSILSQRRTQQSSEGEGLCVPCTLHVQRPGHCWNSWSHVQGI